MYETACLSHDTLDAIAKYAARATWPTGFNVYQRGSPADGVAWRDLHDGVGGVVRGSMIEFARSIAIGMICRWDGRWTHCVSARLDGRRIFLAH